jgi:hypothetical protein
MENNMITCFIRYELDPFKKEQFEQYARNWGEAIPRCGADLIGYFAPHEGSNTLAYGVYNIESLAVYESYRARLMADPIGRENYEFARREKFIRREDRTFLKLASMPHGQFAGA